MCICEIIPAFMPSMDIRQTIDAICKDDFDSMDISMFCYYCICSEITNYIHIWHVHKGTMSV